MIELQATDQSARAGDGKPAELPEPAFTLRWDDRSGYYKVNRPGIGLVDCYTADQMRVALAAAPAAAPATTLTLTGEMHTMGDMGEDDMPLPETPRVVIGLADGRDLMVIGLTRDEVRALAQLFMERVTVQVGAAVQAPATGPGGDAA